MKEVENRWTKALAQLSKKQLVVWKSNSTKILSTTNKAYPQLGQNDRII